MPPGTRSPCRVGMDAQYKSDLVSSALEIESKDALMTFTVADAKRRLAARGWTPWLERKRAALAAKAKAKQAKAAELHG